MSKPKIVIRSLCQPGDLGWVVMAHGEVYATEFSCDTSLEVTVAQDVASYARRSRPREGAWIAEVDRRRAGCVSVSRGTRAQRTCGSCSWSPGRATSM